jgi:hypothetical protein
MRKEHESARENFTYKIINAGFFNVCHQANAPIEIRKSCADGIRNEKRIAAAFSPK